MPRKIITFYCSLLIFGLVLSGCGQSKTVHDERAAGLIPTIYYKPVVYTEQDKCSSNDLVDMKDDQGKILASLCNPTYKNCVLQGSCYVISKGVTKMVGYAGLRQGGGYNFTEVDYVRCPYGWGTKEICVDPYYSVAADLAYYKAGDVIFVEKIAGTVLPDGQVHDGYLLVRDEGGGIKGIARFDFFTGLLDHRSKKNPFARLGLGDPDKRFAFRVVTGNEAEAARKRRNYPGIPESVVKGFRF